jgi:adenine-specific DNA methylase
MDHSLDNDRKNGVYYTPAALAEFLAKPLIKSEPAKLLDPAYGEGSLLLAAEKVARAKKIRTSVQLYGCDTKPVNGLLEHLPQANLKKTDFFEFSTQNKFDIILMNPPYVRHHFQDNSLIAKYRKRFPDLELLTFKADLWAYFMVKAVLHLTHDACIGAILPWSFLQAEYAQELRKWLAKHFREITIVSLNEKYFDNAEARIVLVWLKGFGYPNKAIQLAYAKNLQDKFVYSNVDINTWSANDIVRLGNTQGDRVLKICREKYGFIQLGKICEVKIGVVTGSDGFFLLQRSQLTDYTFEESQIVSVLSNSREFPSLLNGTITNLKVLPVLRAGEGNKHKRFLAIGRKMKAHLSAHAKRRNSWFAVNTGPVADAFFPYRAVKTPFLLFNEFDIQCTNSVHRLYFRNLNNVQRKWIAVSLLSNISQLSIEKLSKTYGKGMLKIEPSSLKEVLVIKRDDPSIIPIYNLVYAKLRLNNRDSAVRIATKFINSSLSIPQRTSSEVNKALKVLYSSRLGDESIGKQGKP